MKSLPEIVMLSSFSFNCTIYWRESYWCIPDREAELSFKFI